MPETPDFEEIAQPLIDKLSDTMDPDNARVFVLEQLRIAWNARGAADVALVEKEQWHPDAPGCLPRMLDKLDL